MSPRSAGTTTSPACRSLAAAPTPCRTTDLPPTPVPPRGAARLGALGLWLIGLTMAARFLGASAAPYRTHIMSTRWWASTPVEQSVVAALGMIGLALVAWLALTTVTGLVLGVIGLFTGRRGSLPAWWHRVSPAVVRRVVGGAVSVGLSVAAVGPVGATGSAEPATSMPSDPPVLVLVDEPTTPTSSPPPATVSAPDTAAPDAAHVGPATHDATPPEAITAEPVGADPGPSVADALTWTIEPGDHLWHVASATLAWARGQAAADDDVAAYLERLIAANADVVAVSGNADVVFAGQTFLLPPLEDAGTTSRSAT